MTNSGTIRAGMGGWTFEPWDTSFYPDKLSKAKQLQYASRQVPTIEVNGTYYSSFKEPTFLKWAAESPDGFVFSLKGNRFVTNRRVLGEAGESMMRFLGSGITALGEKLGPILWQFAPTKKFDADDFEAFLKLLPEKQDGVPLRHAVEVRHRFLRRAGIRRAGAQIQRGDRLCRPRHLSGHRRRHGRFRLCAAADRQRRQSRLLHARRAGRMGRACKSLGFRRSAGRPAPRRSPDSEAPVKPRDVFVYFITEGKIRAPHGAMALMKRLNGG